MVQIHSETYRRPRSAVNLLKAVLKDYNKKSACYYSAADCSIALKVDVSMHYDSAEIAELLDL